MPIECSTLEGQPVPFLTCPNCGAPFRPFLRGMVQRGVFSGGLLCWSWWKALFKRERWPYCALICWECKEIVGYE
jgi:hypothetical protein